MRILKIYLVLSSDSQGKVYSLTKKGDFFLTGPLTQKLSKSETNGRIILSYIDETNRMVYKNTPKSISLDTKAHPRFQNPHISGIFRFQIYPIYKKEKLHLIYF